MSAFPSNRSEAKGTQFQHLFETPSHWPDEVHYITNDNLGDLGRHTRTNQLYWRGDPLVTEKRFSNFERGLAVAGLVIAAIGVAATAVQAWVAVVSLSPMPPG